ncbi:MAG TPA: peptidoglycan-binding domain-containing protein [Bradyrhizobium sp.]|nr:peptidoglycan-binding domain-containing protein [Bradyrhizobium sp.]
MPRKLSRDGDRSRRRNSRSIAIDAGTEHGFAMRILLHSPKDVAAGVMALIAVSAIIVNALFLQAGRHPAPMFGSVTTLPAVALASNPLPRPRPVDAEMSPSEPRPTGDVRTNDSKTNDPKAADPLGSLVKTTTITTSVAPTAVSRPPMPVPVSHVEGAPMSDAGSHRVAAVQRALSKYGYGQLRPTGVVGPDTQAAIQKFERLRKLPVTGQISDRLVRELTATIGHPIE